MEKKTYLFQKKFDLFRPAKRPEPKHEMGVFDDARNNPNGTLPINPNRTLPNDPNYAELPPFVVSEQGSPPPPSPTPRQGSRPFTVNYPAQDRWQRTVDDTPIQPPTDNPQPVHPPTHNTPLQPPTVDHNTPLQPPTDNTPRKRGRPSKRDTRIAQKTPRVHIQGQGTPRNGQKRSRNNNEKETSPRNTRAHNDVCYNEQSSEEDAADDVTGSKPTQEQEIENDNHIPGTEFDIDFEPFESSPDDVTMTPMRREEDDTLRDLRVRKENLENICKDKEDQLTKLKSDYEQDQKVKKQKREDLDRQIEQLQQQKRKMEEEEKKAKDLFVEKEAYMTSKLQRTNTFIMELNGVLDRLSANTNQD